MRLRSIPPDHGADSRQEHDDTHAGPDDRFSRRSIADERFMGPIAGVGKIDTRAVGRSRPGSPKEEGRELSQFVGIALRFFGNGITSVAIAEYIGIVPKIGFKGPRT